jgi:hypothetical protein
METLSRILIKIDPALESENQMHLPLRYNSCLCAIPAKTNTKFSYGGWEPLF